MEKIGLPHQGRPHAVFLIFAHCLRLTLLTTLYMHRSSVRTSVFLAKFARTAYQVGERTTELWWIVVYVRTKAWNTRGFIDGKSFIEQEFRLMVFFWEGFSWKIQIFCVSIRKRELFQGVSTTAHRTNADFHQINQKTKIYDGLWSWSLLWDFGFFGFLLC